MIWVWGYKGIKSMEEYGKELTGGWKYAISGIKNLGSKKMLTKIQNFAILGWREGLELRWNDIIKYSELLSKERRD
jgi:hypothetical protein